MKPVGMPRGPSALVKPTLVCLERHTRARGRDVERDLLMILLGWAAGVASAILFVVEFAK